MELKPFDPADYLDSEEGIEAYLADASQDGAASLSHAVEVVARARARMAGRLARKRSKAGSLLPGE